MRVMKLDVSAADLATCVSCGLCLPHCPTYRVTGEEALSPRGRIAAMRAVHSGAAEPGPGFVEFIETCVQCRGCETACPSGVPFGRLMEGTRHTLAEQQRITPRWQRWAYAALRHHRLLLIGSTLLAAGQRLRLVPKRLGVSRLALRRGKLAAPTGTDVYLYPGCVMDAWMRSTHRSTATVLDAIGITYRYPAAGGCCGALHVHAGLVDEAADLARRTIAAMPGAAPVVVNSAGCGAAMKDYGRLLGTPEAVAFSARVRDASEFVGEHAADLPELAELGPVIVQDPCHLRHVQRQHLAVRSVLAGVATLIELDDDGLCCGAGGAYASLQPALAGQIAARKAAAIQRASSAADPVVASANPGCAMQLRNQGFDVRHPMDLLAEAIERGRR